MAHAPLRAGMFGVGTIAVISYGLLPGLKEMQDDVTVVAVADPAIQRAQAVAGEYGIPHVSAEGKLPHYVTRKEAAKEP